MQINKKIPKTKKVSKVRYSCQSIIFEYSLNLILDLFYELMNILGTLMIPQSNNLADYYISRFVANFYFF